MRSGCVFWTVFRCAAKTYSKTKKTKKGPKPAKMGIEAMKKTVLFFVLSAMVGMCLGLSSNLMAAGETVDPSQLQ